MRELNSYKEEIFRRSEEKKRQLRRNRRIALGVGIPLCLCAVLTATVIPLLPMGRKGDMMLSPESVYDYDVMENEAMKGAAQETFLVTDTQQIAQVLSFLEGEELRYSYNGEQPDTEDHLADKAETASYELILCHPDGSEAHYQIWGQTVFCETTGETVLISEQQSQALYTLLTAQE